MEATSLFNAEAWLCGKRTTAVHHAHRREAKKILPHTIHLSRLHKTTDRLGEKIRKRGIHVRVSDAPDPAFVGVAHPDPGLQGLMSQRYDPLVLP